MCERFDDGDGLPPPEYPTLTLGTGSDRSARPATTGTPLVACSFAISRREDVIMMHLHGMQWRVPCELAHRL